MRIAILLTSNDKSDFANRFPNDGQKFVTLLHPLRPDWTYEVYPVMDDVFPASIGDYDGIIITGSPASVHDRHDWIDRLLNLIREADEKRMPLVGACFGHQAVAVALGGTVGKNPQGWVLGTAKTLIENPADWMMPPRDTLTLYAAHKEQVTRLPDGAQRIGTTPGCSNAAFVVGNHMMTTQYHPEMTLDFMDELVDEMGDSISANTATEARALYARGEEGKLYAEWMVTFLESRAKDREAA